eukprot:2681611-Lingulodinium_polyedra.AAC.1
MAGGQWQAQLALLAQLLNNHKKLGFMGIEVSHDAHRLHDVDHAEQLFLAETLFSLITSALSRTIQDNRFYSESPPMIFSSFCSHVANQRQAAFDRCKDLWAALEHFERLALEDDSNWLKGFIHDLLWPDNIWCREMMIGCVECHWQAVPLPALEEISALVSGMSTTKPIEDLSN